MQEFIERPNEIGGVQRLYKLPNGYTLSTINAKISHSYPFAWEFGVIDDATDCLTYTTPLTSDVETVITEAEAEAFIEKAYQWAEAK